MREITHGRGRVSSAALRISTGDCRNVVSTVTVCFCINKVQKQAKRNDFLYEHTHAHGKTTKGSRGAAEGMIRQGGPNWWLD